MSVYIYIYIYIHTQTHIHTKERPRNAPSLAINLYKLQCFQRHTAGYLNVMFSTRGLVVADGCRKKIWEANCAALYCVSTSQTFIVIFIKARIFKFLLMTVCCNVITIILSC